MSNVGNGGADRKTKARLGKDRARRATALYFSRMRWIRQSDLPGTERAVLTALIWWDKDKGDGLWPSLDAIAEASGFVPRTVKAALDRLERKGVIARGKFVWRGQVKYFVPLTAEERRARGRMGSIRASSQAGSVVYHCCWPGGHNPEFYVVDGEDSQDSEVEAEQDSQDSAVEAETDSQDSAVEAEEPKCGHHGISFREGETYRGHHGTRFHDSTATMEPDSMDHGTRCQPLLPSSLPSHDGKHHSPRLTAGGFAASDSAVIKVKESDSPSTALDSESTTETEKSQTREPPRELDQDAVRQPPTLDYRALKRKAEQSRARTQARLDRECIDSGDEGLVRGGNGELDSLRAHPYLRRLARRGVDVDALFGGGAE